MAFRLANRLDRAVLIIGDKWWDLEAASRGTFDSTPLAAIERWRELSTSAESITRGEPDGVVDHRDLLPPVSRPSKILAVGLNYQPHADESKLVVPDYPMVFPIFASCLTGPASTVFLPSDTVDWEVELVLVVGDRAHQVSEADALSIIAGATV